MSDDEKRPTPEDYARYARAELERSYIPPSWSPLAYAKEALLDQLRKDRDDLLEALEGIVADYAFLGPRVAELIARVKGGKL